MSFRQQRINRPQLALRRLRSGPRGRNAIARVPDTDAAALATRPDFRVAKAEPAVVETSTAGRWAVTIIVITSVVWLAGFGIGFLPALTINMIIGLVLAILGLVNPAVGLFAIGILAALDAIGSQYIFTGGFLRFNTVNYFLLVVMALYLPFLLRLRDLNSRLLMLFLLLISLQLIYSLDKGKGIQDVLNILTTFGMVIYFARALNDRLALYWLGIVLGTLAGLGGLIYFLQINQLPYANPNNWTYFQITALFAICISFYYAQELNRGKFILLLLAVINFAWVFLSGSRGSLLISLLAIVYLFLASRSITWQSLMIATALLIGIWISASFAEQQVYMISRIQMLFDENLTESQRTSQRSLLARAGVDIFLKNPLGIGTGSFRDVVAETSFLQRNRPAHSAWIKTLAENGVPGILLMAFFISSFAIMGLKKNQGGLLFYGFFITLTLASAFVVKEFQGKSLWFLTASGIVLLNVDQMRDNINRKFHRIEVDSRRRLREIRFGKKR